MPEPLRLLLAEDDPVSRTFLHAVLSLDHPVDTAADGASALRMARTRRYALLLLDLNLPALRGPDLLQQLRADRGAASLRSPALALTADDDPATRITLLGTGFAAVLGKPISANRLRQAVVEWIADPLALAPFDAGRSPQAAAPVIDRDAIGRLPDWDDDAALRAANGNPAIVTALRGLLCAELPAQCERLRRAIDATELADARAELHKLRAAAGFCGAPRLVAAVEWLVAECGDGRPSPAALQFLLDAATRLTLGATPPQ